MRVIQTFNNNVALTLDDLDNEVVVMGKGVGFQKKKGDYIHPNLIDKEFVLTENISKSMFPDIYRELSPNEIDLIVEIIDMAEKKLNVEFQSNIYISLADHIQFMLERVEQILPLTNPLSYEVKKYYSKEYEVAKEAIQLIERRLEIKLPKDEVASIALHFVTGQQEGYLISQTIKVTEIVHNIINILQQYYREEFNEDSVSYARFLTHVQYFAHRVVFGKDNGETDSFLYEKIKESYITAFNCVKKIKEFVETDYDFEMSQSEQVYLTIHIQRMISEE